MSIFDFAEELMAGALTDTFGTSVRIIPKQASRIVVGVNDPTRPQYEILAAVSSEEIPTTAQGDGTRNGRTPALMQRVTVLSIQRSLVIAPNELPVEGDEVLVLAKPGQPERQYRIVFEHPFGEAFAEYELMPVAE